MKNIIKEIIQENQYAKLPQPMERNVNIDIESKIIVTLIGVRRSGKTYLLYDTILKLKKNGVPKEHIVFINFEDERLNFKTQDLDLIVQAYTELYPESDLNNVYFFFDEIQNVHGWEKFIRRIYDTKSQHIFITGSNAKLLSTEIATSLRGRTISYVVYPLNLAEYLNFNQVDQRLYPQKNKSKIVHYTEKFLYNGGFPDTINMPQATRIKLLQQYFNVMIFRDIVERYAITNIEVLKFFIKKIFTSVTKPFSINKAYNDLKSMGYKISNKYLYSYFEYCNDIFLSQSIGRFDYSAIKQAKSEKKTYIIDTGLLASIDFSMSSNKGKLLENMVFLEFLKSGCELFYFKNNYECDFIVKQGARYLPVQVSYEISNTETKNRAIKGLAEACEYLQVNKGIIITFDHEETLQYGNITVEFCPVYKYFLNH